MAALKIKVTSSTSPKEGKALEVTGFTPCTGTCTHEKCFTDEPNDLNLDILFEMCRTVLQI